MVLWQSWETTSAEVETLAMWWTWAYNWTDYHIEDGNKAKVAQILWLPTPDDSINLYAFMGASRIFQNSFRNAARNLLLADGTLINEFLDSEFTPYIRLQKNRDGTIGVSYRTMTNWAYLSEGAFSEVKIFPSNFTYEEFCAYEQELIDKGLMYIGNTSFESYEPD